MKVYGQRNSNALVFGDWLGDINYLVLCMLEILVKHKCQSGHF